ncbi:MAG TPA: ABC transporter permease [Phycisphaerae bacterium]|nr:ABC transporter permease [Phycisphaerae bacterium]HNU46938.1 ABC transporter permease [Phycisphaerae bacterium]
MTEQRDSAVPAPAPALRGGRAGELWSNPAFTAALALALVFILGLIFSGEGAFYKWGTHRDALRQASVFGILACGMTVVIITAGIDLSVGSLLALAAVAFSIFSIHWGWSPWVAIPLCILVGGACGLVSGSLVALCRIQPFIVTLAMMVFARGLAKWVSGGMKVSTAVPAADGTYTYVGVPAIFRTIDSRWFGGNLSVVTVIFLLCVLVSWVGLARLRWGRYLYAIGGNEEASRLSGVPVAAMKMVAYTLAGLSAAVAGICQAAQEQQGDPEAGSGYELSAIAIVVIGGTNLMGGRGGIGLTLLGTLIIGYIEKILSINAVGEASRLMLTGAIIVIAVLIQRRRS